MTSKLSFDISLGIRRKWRRNVTLPSDFSRLNETTERAICRAKPTTFRLEPDVQEGLVLLARLVEAPLNRLVNEAVRMFVRERTTEIATNMEETLKLLKARRAKDPELRTCHL